MAWEEVLVFYLCLDWMNHGSGECSVFYQDSCVTSYYVYSCIILENFVLYSTIQAEHMCVYRRLFVRSYHPVINVFDNSTCS